MKCDGARAETRIFLSAKQTSSFILAGGASDQSTTSSRGVRISGSNAGYTMFRGSVNSTGYPLHSPVSPSLPLPCVTVCHRISKMESNRNEYHGYTLEGEGGRCLGLTNSPPSCTNYLEILSFSLMSPCPELCRDRFTLASVF